MEEWAKKFPRGGVFRRRALTREADFPGRCSAEYPIEDRVGFCDTAGHVFAGKKKGTGRILLSFCLNDEKKKVVFCHATGNANSI
jgi:hypothetical protein